MTVAVRRWFRFVASAIAGAVLVTAFPAVAQAQPGDPSGVQEEAPPLLSEVLATTGKRYAQAKTKLDTSRRKQLQLSVEVTRAEHEIAELAPQVAEVAAASYRMGKIGPISALLESSDPNGFLERATALSELNMVNDQKLHKLTAARQRAVDAKQALDGEVAEEQRQLTIIAKQKKEAENSLSLVGGKSLTNGMVSATSAVAAPAPRASDGSWPDEGCSVDDPTTGGCITPRTYHAYKEVKKAGFNRFVGCYRPGGPFEHPKGRACDWSLQSSGFSNAHTRDQRLYGNNLTAFLVRNAERLGIMYVIWYAQIWMPTTGWSSYSGASAHKDHVHMSLL
ncbi:coiled-coil domain-containing protein [Phytohabitans aurantiacus]|jgi:hypothetical protein|uniref:ARB-07466-like C-terminal domain-containing protein n=1 Tax=Phytohabitans aurantiacus TaxID=3016789 RepID=A0ABQ5R5U1_9ACTN|nr:hypothetical protein [Phytohabitans aurantiacus]GLI02149.1 hypothetical protein Pa4123_74270 [Phytohabitans aurantiacus]